MTKGKTATTIYLTTEDRQIVEKVRDWLYDHDMYTTDGKNPNLSNVILWGFYYAMAELFGNEPTTVSLHELLQDKKLENYIMGFGSPNACKYRFSRRLEK